MYKLKGTPFRPLFLTKTGRLIYITYQAILLKDFS